MATLAGDLGFELLTSLQAYVQPPFVTGVLLRVSQPPLRVPNTWSVQQEVCPRCRRTICYDCCVDMTRKPPPIDTLFTMVWLSLHPHPT